MPRYELSSEAQADLSALSIYIIEQSGTSRAEHVAMRIRRTLDTLASMPRLGKPRPYVETGLLAFPVPPWVIIYKPLPDAEGIIVARIIDGRRDLVALFGE